MSQKNVLPTWHPIEPHGWAAVLVVIVGGFLCFLVFWLVLVPWLIAGGA